MLQRSFVGERACNDLHFAQQRITQVWLCFIFVFPKQKLILAGMCRWLRRRVATFELASANM